MTQSLSFAEITEVFNDDDKAREVLEKLRWRDGVRCPHCESTKAYKIVARKEGATTRKGLWKCSDCRKQFTVTVGTVFEGTRIPLGKWLMAMHLICGAKKGISALQLMRHLGLKNNYKTAWFMAHRIRYAMSQEPLFGKLKGTLEADETFIGGKSKNMHAKVRKAKITGSGDKNSKAQVLTLVERGGKVKTHHMEHVTSSNLRKVLREHVDMKAAYLMSDENRVYKEVGPRFSGHQSVNHSKEEYVRGVVHVNTAESVHALLKRGVMGTYHHWSKKHLHRYLSEFDFRFNHRKISDGERTAEAILLVGGKRLRYKDPIKKR